MKRYTLQDLVPESKILFNSSPNQKQVSGDPREVVRLRRSIDNAHQTFFGKTPYDVDQNEIATFQDTGDLFINEVFDATDNTKKLVQTTALNQPQYVLDGINGHPAGLFTGFAGTDFTSLNYDLPPGVETPATFFFVTDMQGIQNAANEPLSTKSGATLDNNTFRVKLANFGLYFQAKSDGIGQYTNFGDSVEARDPTVWAIVCDGIDSIYLYKNGSLVPNYPFVIPDGFKCAIPQIHIKGMEGKATEYFACSLALPPRKILEGSNGLMRKYGI